jgi:cell fate (sporulation/competence/biofilm development) regulator YmcA (YheA/YmcA/DUF963 family)
MSSSTEQTAVSIADRIKNLPVVVNPNEESHNVVVKRIEKEIETIVENMDKIVKDYQQKISDHNELLYSIDSLEKHLQNPENELNFLKQELVELESEDKLRVEEYYDHVFLFIFF